MTTGRTCGSCRHCTPGLTGLPLCTVDDDAIRETALDETCEHWAVDSAALARGRQTPEQLAIERAYLEHLGAAESYAWRLQHDEWDQGAPSPRATGFWLNQPRTLRRLADMPKWLGLSSPPIETRDGPDPRVSCKACRGHGWDHRGRTPIACEVCRGQGVVVP